MGSDAMMAMNAMVLLLLVGLVVIVCWIILPFAVLGTKPILRSLLEEQRATNTHLQQLLQALEQNAPRRDQ